MTMDTTLPGPAGPPGEFAAPQRPGRQTGGRDGDSLDRDTALRTVRQRLPRLASLRTIAALILREIGTSYGRSPGGFLWVFAQPILGIGVMVAVFSTGFRTPSLGTSFAVFFASGFLPYMMFTAVTGSVTGSVGAARNLLAYPRVTFMDAILARYFLAVMVQLVVSAVILGVILGIFYPQNYLGIGPILNAYVMAAALALGMGILNCVLTLYYPVWGTVWSVATRPLVILSGVILLHDRIPMPYREWLEWNPLVHVVGASRTGFYYSYRGEYVDTVYVYMFAAITGTVGLVFLRRYYRESMER